MRKSSRVNTSAARPRPSDHPGHRVTSRGVMHLLVNIAAAAVGATIGAIARRLPLDIARYLLVFQLAIIASAVLLGVAQPLAWLHVSATLLDTILRIGCLRRTAR